MSLLVDFQVVLVPSQVMNANPSDAAAKTHHAGCMENLGYHN